MNRINIPAILFIFGFVCKMQCQVGINTANPHPSSMLDISATDKGFLPPRVSLLSLENKTLPIAEPADGLIIYNKSGDLPAGYYIWNQGLWNLMSSFNNSVINNLIVNNTGKIYLNNVSEDIITGGSFQFKSIPNTDYNATTGEMMLPPGKYSLSISLSISSGETSTNALGNIVKAHLHSYTAKVTNLSGTKQYGIDSICNSVSNTSADKKHTADFSFSLDIAASENVVVRFRRNQNNATYSGNITIQNTIIHIQKIQSK